MRSLMIIFILLSLVCQLDTSKGIKHSGRLSLVFEQINPHQYLTGQLEITHIYLIDSQDQAIDIQAAPIAWNIDKAGFFFQSSEIGAIPKGEYKALEIHIRDKGLRLIEQRKDANLSQRLVDSMHQPIINGEEALDDHSISTRLFFASPIAIT
ncbi:MAG: hypothetical protein OXE99_00475, partial [Cellvibrionales bacterium]|nr:hypothetical protein [Cellvibrionales bacterium]